MSSPPRVTELLLAWGGGDQGAFDNLLPLIYGELRRLAAHYLRGERPDHTLQPTALVHEAYLRLVGQTGTSWQNRAHFFGAAAQVMRRILVDQARQYQASKRGGGEHKVTLAEGVALARERDVNLLALEEALTRLEGIAPEQCRVVELRFFGGLSIDEAAEVMGVSEATVTRQWRAARAWLRRELRKGGAA
jgi:RNA polymerase sigma factor (TIGR02999 family)